MSFDAVLDTSVLVRLLTNDDPVKAADARRALHAAADASFLVPDVAVAEVAFVLLRVYHWPIARVADAMRAIVNHPAIEAPGREIWLDVADDLERGTGPVDAYLVRTAERHAIPAVLTFDEGMRALPGVRCTAP